MPDLYIDERQLIPVRMIPFSTGWIWSPDVTARILAHQDEHYCVKLDSYYLAADDTPHKKLPKEWDRIRADLNNISNLLRHDEPAPHTSYKEWRLQSIDAIPSTAFVWLDELTAAYHKSFPKDKETRQGDSVLTLTPDITPQEKKQIYEGFKQLAFSKPGYLKPNTGRDAGKTKTELRNTKWRLAINELSSKYPHLSHHALCKKLSQMDISEGKSAETIRRVTKPTQ